MLLMQPCHLDVICRVGYEQEQHTDLWYKSEAQSEHAELNWCLTWVGDSLVW